MTTTYPKDRSSIVDKVIIETQQRNPKALDDTLLQFLHHYFADVPFEDLKCMETIDLCGAALCHWQLGLRCNPEQSVVNVYNPHFEKHGWQSTHTIIEVITYNKPFLVDSLSLAINRAGLTAHLTIHPVFAIERDAKGAIKALGKSSENACTESYMHFQVDKQTDPQALDALKHEILTVIDDVQRVTDDWKPIHAKALALVKTIKKERQGSSNNDRQSLCTFINWLTDNHFTFLGYCEFTRNSAKDEATLQADFATTLGLLRGASADRLASIVPYTNPYYIKSNWLIDITKTDANSTVHRPSPMDLVTVQRYDNKGKRIGHICFVGLFTSAAYNLSVDDVPLLREKVAQVIEQTNLARNSHSSKAISNILESYPRDALFQSPVEDVLSIAVGILHLQERQRIRLFGRCDQYRRFQSCMVYVPRERYSRELRLKIQAILMDAFNGTGVEFDTLFSSESILARIYYVIRTDPRQPPNTDFARIEQRIINAALSWQDKLGSTLHEQFGEEQGNHFFNHYQSAFPSSYKDHFHRAPPALIFSILKLRAITMHWK